MSGNTAQANTSLPPPRLSGQQSADALMQLRWLNDFYDQYTKVLNVPGAIATLDAAGLLAAPSGWLTTITNEIAALTTSVTPLTAAVATLTTTLTALQTALTTAGILPITTVPGVNQTAIDLLVHNTAGVNIAPITLTVPNGGGAGFRALVVPN